MNLVEEQLSKIPIWVQFYNVPLDYWTEEGLSYIARAVGKPLYADTMTVSCKRLSFARICVKVDVHSVLTQNIDLQLANGMCFEVMVKYQWKPLKCSNCKVFGHNESSCQVKEVPNQVGSPVKKQVLLSLKGLVNW